MQRRHQGGAPRARCWHASGWRPPADARSTHARNACLHLHLALARSALWSPGSFPLSEFGRFKQQVAGGVVFAREEGRKRLQLPSTGNLRSREEAGGGRCGWRGRGSESRPLRQLEALVRAAALDVGEPAGARRGRQSAADSPRAQDRGGGKGRARQGQPVPGRRDPGQPRPGRPAVRSRRLPRTAAGEGLRAGHAHGALPPSSPPLLGRPRLRAVWRQAIVTRRPGWCARAGDYATTRSMSTTVQSIRYARTRTRADVP